MKLKIDSQTKKKIPSSVNFEMSTSSSIKKYKSIKPKKNQQKVPNSRNKKKIKTLKKLYLGNRKKQSKKIKKQKKKTVGGSDTQSGTAENEQQILGAEENTHQSELEHRHRISKRLAGHSLSRAVVIDASGSLLEESHEDESMFHSCLSVNSNSMEEQQQKRCEELFSSCDGSSSPIYCERLSQLGSVVSSGAAEEPALPSSSAEEKPSRLNSSVLIHSIKTTLKVTNIYVINNEEQQQVEVENGQVCKPENNKNFFKPYGSESRTIIEFDSRDISEDKIDVKKIDTTKVTKTILGKEFILANDVKESKITFNKENNSTFKTIISEPNLIGFNPNTKKMELQIVLGALDFKTTVSFKLSDETELMTYTIPFKIS